MRERRWTHLTVTSIWLKTMTRGAPGFRMRTASAPAATGSTQCHDWA